MADDFIERRILTGLIVSAEYIRTVMSLWDSRYISSSVARELAGWCIEHYKKYKAAPGRDIEGIYASKLNAGMRKDKAEFIEEILASLSRDYEREQFNLPYLLDETEKYFKERHIVLFCDRVKDILVSEGPMEAERAASTYVSPSRSTNKAIDPFANRSRRMFSQAFAQGKKPLLTFGGALGKFWNEQFTRDAFVALMAPEKRGKSYMLLEIAMRAMKANCNVAFFQAGDMSERQQLRRMGVYLAGRSDQKRYCGEMFKPVKDCEYNQLDECKRRDRECDFGVLDELPKRLKYDELERLCKENLDYIPCQNSCGRRKDAVWFERIPETDPLKWQDAWKKAIEWKAKHKKQFVLCTYANETLAVAEINSLLDMWEHQNQFVPDVIVIDYADILAPEPDIRMQSMRDQTNKIWQRLRNLSQARHCLVVTATQANAASYGVDRLRKINFSEDKRKYAHVTAMYGLNQNDEEKKIGILRINELVIREGEFYESNEVHVLQRLQIGKPYLGSIKFTSVNLLNKDGKNKV